MLIPIVQGGLGYFTLVLDISSNVTEYNVLTAATAAGYNASTDVRPIVVNVASGVTVSGSTTHAMRTGVLNAATSLTINIAGSVDGYTGANGTATVVGSVGGDAIYWETAGTSVVNVANGANLRSGGGGGGGGGNRGITQKYDGKSQCEGPYFNGSYGGTGSSGGFGISGTSGGSGSYSTGAGSNPCIIQAIGAGAAGGAAGFAIRENSNTITVNNSGTIAGTIG
jgi:hypothetical protein